MQIDFVRDTAQLPPVNLEVSPALDEDELTAQVQYCNIVSRSKM